MLQRILEEDENTAVRCCKQVDKKRSYGENEI